MMELVWISLVESLLKDRKAPSFCSVGLLHGIAVTLPAVGNSRVAHKKIRIDHAARPIHLTPVVHATMLCPAVLRYGRHAVVIFHDHHRIVLTAGPSLVKDGRHTGHNAPGPCISAQHPAEPSESVASH